MYVAVNFHGFQDSPRAAAIQLVKQQCSKTVFGVVKMCRELLPIINHFLGTNHPSAMSVTKGPESVDREISSPT